MSCWKISDELRIVVKRVWIVICSKCNFWIVIWVSKMDPCVWVALMGLLCSGRMFLLRCLFAFWGSIALSGLTSVLMLILLQHLKLIHLHIQGWGPRGLLGTKSSCHLVTQLNKKRYAFRIVIVTSSLPLANYYLFWHLFLRYQMLEVIRLEGHFLPQEDAFISRDIHLLQVLSSVSWWITRKKMSLTTYMGNWMLNPEYIFKIRIAFVAVMSWNWWECCGSLLWACLCSNWWNVSRWRPTAPLWFSRYSIGFKISWVFHLNLSLVVLTILSIWLTADVRITHVQADNKSISTSHFQKFVESIILVCCTQFKCFDRRYMPYSGIQVSLKVRLFNEYYRIKNPWQTSNMCNRQNSSLTLVVGHCDFYLLVAK